MVDMKTLTIDSQQFEIVDAEARSDISSLQAAVGSPLVASTVSAMTDHNKVYVYTGSESGYTSGNWYYWNGSAWTSGGVYNSQGINTDKTLSVEDVAADAKKTGDEIDDLKSALDNLGESFTLGIDAGDGLLYLYYNGVKIGDGVDISGGSAGTRYSIAWNLRNCTSSNNASSILENRRLLATITPNQGYTIGDVAISMGNNDITSSSYSNGVVNINSVTGNVEISITAKDYLTGRLLTWEDDFDGTSVNWDKWRSSTNMSNGIGAFTYQRAENTFVSNSILTLRALKDGYIDGYDWSSGRIDTLGKFAMLYGRIDCRLKYTPMNGAFPAFWFLGSDSRYPSGPNGPYGKTRSTGAPWPFCGEVDVVEGLGDADIMHPGYAYQTDPARTDWIGASADSVSVDQSEWHVYGLEWTPDKFEYYLDNVKVGEQTITGIRAFQKPYYIILNMAVGAAGGTPDDDATMMDLYVDYVRVYAPVGTVSKVQPTGINFIQDTVLINSDDGEQYFDYDVIPSNAYDQFVDFTSSDSSVVEVSGTRLTPKATGNAVITALLSNGLTDTFDVTVGTNLSISYQTLTFDSNSLSINEDRTYEIPFSGYPRNANETLTWSSSNASVATVSNGVLTTLTPGTASITVSGNTASATIPITVNAIERMQILTNGLTLKLDKNGMYQYEWKNEVDSQHLQWHNGYNVNKTGADSNIKLGDGYYYYERSSFSDISMLPLNSYYDFTSDKTLFLAFDGTDMTAATNILAGIGTNTQASNLRLYCGGYMVARNGSSADILKLNPSGTRGLRKIVLCIRKNGLTVTEDFLAHGETQETYTGTLSEAYTPVADTYGFKIRETAAFCKFHAVAVYNRVLTDAEVASTLNVIDSFVFS